MSKQDIDISCFENIIGLSRTTCECYPENLYSESESDLYLDELEGLNLKMIDGMADCEDGNVWQIMEKARNNAIIRFIGDANSKLLKRAKLKREPFYGTIGRRVFKNTRSLSTTYAGVRFFCADIVSGALIVKKIGTAFSASGAITLSIYNNFNELVSTQTLTTVANTFHENVLTTPLELPLHNSYTENLEYFFIYTVGSNKPKDNDLSCNCGGFRPAFNVAAPYFFRTQTNKQYGWANYCMVGSVAKNDLDFTDCGSTTNNYMNGLTFDVEFKCFTQEVLCKDYLDFEANPLAIDMALAIQYKAGEFLLEDLLSSENLTRYTMMNVENTIELIKKYQVRYDEYLTYLTNKLNILSNDCFVCDDIIKVQRSGIMATYGKDNKGTGTGTS